MTEPRLRPAPILCPTPGSDVPASCQLAPHPWNARGSPSPRTAAAGTPLFLSPTSLLLLLLLRLPLSDSSRRILHVNNIQALFTVAAGPRGTHASTLEEGGGRGKASAQHLHTHTPHPAPPRRSPSSGPARGAQGPPAPSYVQRDA